MLFVYAICLLVLVFLLLPTRIGAAGAWTGTERSLRAWIRPMGGLIGVHAAIAPGPVRVSPVLGGLVLPGLRVKGSEKETKDEAEDPDGQKREGPGDSEAEREEEEGPREDRGLRDRIRKLRGDVGRYKPPALRFLRRLARSIRVRHVDVDVHFGASNPEATGRLFGYLAAFAGPVGGRRATVRMTPDFVEPRLEGRGRIDVWLFPWQLAIAVLLFGVRVGAMALVDRIRARFGLRQEDTVPA